MANCQGGVSLHLASDHASAAVDWRLFLPPTWGPAPAKADADKVARRGAYQIPDGLGHVEQWQLALALTAAEPGRNGAGHGCQPSTTCREITALSGRTPACGGCSVNTSPPSPSRAFPSTPTSRSAHYCPTVEPDTTARAPSPSTPRWLTSIHTGAVPFGGRTKTGPSHWSGPARLPFARRRGSRGRM
ncbi:transposase [Streptomyces spiralis]